MNEVDFSTNLDVERRPRYSLSLLRYGGWVDIPLENIASLSVASGGRVYEN